MQKYSDKTHTREKCSHSRETKLQAHEHKYTHANIVWHTTHGSLPIPGPDTTSDHHDTTQAGGAEV